MDITANKRELSKLKYLCEQCDPKAHKPLLDAISRGERPWEARGGPVTQQKKKAPSKVKGSKAAKDVKPESPSPATGGQAEGGKGLQDGLGDSGKRKRSAVEPEGSLASVST